MLRLPLVCARRGALRASHAFQSGLWLRPVPPLRTTEASRRYLAKKSKGGNPEAQLAQALSGVLLTEVDFNELSDRATEVEESLAKTLQGFHGSRPDPSMFENLEVMAYGSPTTLASVAQVVLKSPKSATITVFDPSVTPAVRDALLSAKMDLNPEVDGSNINLYIPKQTRETREEMAKVVGRHVEHAKHALRKLRKAAMDDVAKAEAEDFPEDDAQREKDIVDVLIKKATERLDKQHDAKKRELLESPSAS